MEYDKLFNTSSIRNNSISWLELDDSDRILAIGDGCIGLLDYLKRSTSMVDFVSDAEMQKKPLCGSVERKYDLIIIYSQKIEAMLGFAKNNISNKGRIIIFANNPLGVSFFNGLIPKEEDSFYATINYNSKSLRGNYYRKEEIQSELARFEIKNYRFFYPYPNMDFCYQIYSDNRLPEIGELHIENYPYKTYRMEMFREQNLYDRFIEAGEYDKFANSFIVVCGIKTPDVDYVKYSNERNDGLNISTEIHPVNGTKRVIKKACDKASESHIAHIYSSYLKLDELFQGSFFSVNKCRRIDNKTVEFEFIDGKSLDVLMDEILRGKDIDGFYKLLNVYLENIRKIYSQGYACDLDVDLIFQNIIVNDGKWNVIDYEWTLEKELPVDYLIYRAIRYYYYQSDVCRRTFPNVSSLYEYCGIGIEDLEEYNNFEVEFQNFVAGDSWKLSDEISDEGIIRLNDSMLHLQIEMFCRKNQFPEKVINKKIPIIGDRISFEVQVKNADKIKISTSNVGMIARINIDGGAKLQSIGEKIGNDIYSYPDTPFFFYLFPEKNAHVLKVTVEIITDNNEAIKEITEHFITERDEINYKKLADERLDTIDELKRLLDNKSIKSVIRKIIRKIKR